MTEDIDVNMIVNHWIDSSDKDYETMLHLYASGDYTWSLFIGHIVLEKLLKAMVVKASGNHAPFTHDLTKLAALTQRTFSEEQLDWLDAVTTFNLNTRYDSYKQAFRKKCTAEFSQAWIERIKQLRAWIKEKQ